MCDPVTTVSSKRAGVIIEDLEERRLFSAAPLSARQQAHLAHLAHLNHLAHVAHLAHLRHLNHLAYVARLSKAAASAAKVGSESEESGDGDSSTTYGAAPAAVRAGLQAIAPSGITLSSSQKLDIEDQDGKVVYSTEVATRGGMSTKLAVDSHGRQVKENEQQDESDDNTEEGGNDAED